MKRPNILFIYTDQLRWDAIGANGNKEVHTPNLDRLAAQGVNFGRHFVQNPYCMPSRVSCLSGRYPSTLGITHMGVPVPEELDTLPELLKPYGYTCANIGKLHFWPHANRDHRDPHPLYGFDQLELSDEPGMYEDAYRAWVRGKAPDQLDRISVGLPKATEIWNKTMGVEDHVVHPPERLVKKAVASRCTSDVTHSAFVAEQTMSFINEQADRTWFCIASFYSPHSPWVAPQEFLDKYNPDHLQLPSYPSEVDQMRKFDYFSDEELRSVRHGYYAMISEVDDYVGKILDELERLDLLERTLIVFTSDHGEWLGDHLKYGKGFPAPDCVSRVPLIIRWPQGVEQPGRTVQDIVEAVDLAPTLLECAGIQPPSYLQGQSLLPFLRNESAPGKGSAIMEFHGWKSLRTDQFHYVSCGDGGEMLFDLDRDPGEYQNVVDDKEYGAVLSEHRGLLLQRILQAETPLKRSWTY